MSAHADDLRFFYAELIGRSQTFAVTDAGSTKVAEALTPGRYLAYPIGLTGRVWVRQGAFADVSANAAEPSMPMEADSVRSIQFMVRSGPTGKNQTGSDGIAAIASAGGSCTMVVVKISRES